VPTALRLLKYGLHIAESEAKQRVGIGAEGGLGLDRAGGTSAAANEQDGEMDPEDVAAAVAAKLGCIEGLCACMRQHQQDGDLVADLLH